MKFNKTIYVRIEKETNSEEEYLVATTSPDGGNGEKVGIYELKEVKVMKITEQLV